MTSTIVGLDIGTSKVTAVVGELLDDNKLNIIGVGITPSEGLQKGIVVDIEKATRCIQKAVEEAQRMADLAIDYVYIGIAGSHIESRNNVAAIQLQNPNSCISSSDIEKLLAEVSNVSVPSGKELIHSIVREFKVDEQENVKSPQGMVGSRLGVSAHLVFGATNSIRNLVSCAHNVNLDVAQVILQPLASSEAVLTEDEKRLGVILVDIGGGTTDIAVFEDGKLSHTSVIPLGGWHFTNDLAYCLRTSYSEAEKIKVRYGCVDNRLVEKNLTLEIGSAGSDEKRKIAADALCEILQPRAEELVSLVMADVKAAMGDNLDKFAAGLTVTGGGAQIRGLEQMFKKMGNLPVRIGRIRNVCGLAEKVSSPVFATAVGLILYGYKYHELLDDSLSDESFFERIINTIKGWFL
jgi:cell division protein FtsA